ncbi:MAG: ribose-5-phosphate isomerase [Geodermatophilaceae bacterium]|nr:ribose-5-phosphate isomerase [Geodermatophilaceae bacterium]
MRVYLGSDHAGFELKAELLSRLSRAGHDTVDLGPSVHDPEDDYPAYCLATGAAVVADPGSLGVVIGGSGNGEQIAANKVPGVRCALAWDVEAASLGRLHNDANVVSLGARMVDEATAVEIVDTFVATAFSGQERHARRIAQLTEYERTHALPERPAG